MPNPSGKVTNSQKSQACFVKCEGEYHKHKYKENKDYKSKTELKMAVYSEKMVCLSNLSASHREGSVWCEVTCVSSLD